ncbi:hypothetical protein KKA14_13745, partial [bacterium]|nr:hypothetical protein [bacterium]
MIDSEKKLEILKNNNPFISSSSGDPWGNPYPDVESINNHVFEFLSDIVRQKKKDLANGFAALVLGEAGSGKTHLISRLLKPNKTIGSNFLFSYIQPIEDSNQTYRYLLREIVVSLCRPVDRAGKYTQFDILLGCILKELLTKKIRLKKERAHSQKQFISKLDIDPLFYQKSKVLNSIFNNELIAKAGKNLLLSQYADLDESFVTILFLYRIPKYRVAALGWLKGAILDERDNQLLNVRDRHEMTGAALEQDARDILYSLGLILARYNQLLVVCFDRLENLETKEHIRSFGKMVEFMVDYAQAMLPVAFFRGYLWEEKFRNTLNEHVVTRLEGNKILLKACDPKQAMEIIGSRLSYAFKNDIGDDFFPLNKEKLLDFYKRELLSPREVIIEANRELRNRLGDVSEEKLISPSEKLFEEYLSQYRDLKKDPDQCPPDRERLRHTLILYLENIPRESGFEVISIDAAKHEKECFDCVCKIKFKNESILDVVFIIDDSLHHASVNAKLKKGIEFLNINPVGKVYYIRERRCKFPGPNVWKATNKTLKLFRDNGGIALRLNQEQVAAWYALVFLQYKVKDG